MQSPFLAVFFAVAGFAAALPQAKPTTTSSAPSATCSIGPVVNYTVVSGDTLTIISQRLNSGICNIVAANGLKSADFITLGQVLKVPTLPCTLDNTSCLAKPSQDNKCVKGGPSSYTIASGDTFFLVAQKHGLSIDALSAANPGVDPLLLEVGKSIKIPVC